MNATQSQTIAKSRKASTEVSVNSMTLVMTATRAYFDLVQAGVCPHCHGSFGKEQRSKGVGVTRTCSVCQHRWYVHRKLKRTRCLDCYAKQRRNNGGTKPLVARSI